MPRFLARIVSVIFWLGPGTFRDRFGREIEDGMARGLADAAHAGGAMAMLGFWGRGIGDALKTVEHERRSAESGFGGGRPWADLGGDVRYAWRGWRRSPGFAVTVILTLALGLGLASAIFSFADGYLFRPLPFPGSERAYLVRDPNAAIASALRASDVVALRQSPVGEYGFVEWSMADISGDLVLGDRRVVVSSYEVSPGFRQTLRLPLVAGRDFTADDHVAGAPLVAWLTDRVWRTAFHRDAAVLGRSLRIEWPEGHVDVLVVGILGPEVASFDLNNRPPDLVIPVQGPPRVGPNLLSFPMVLLPEGVTTEQAGERIGATLQAVAPVADGRPRVVRLESVLEVQVAGGKPTAKVFLAGALLVLLLATMNLIHLLLSRATARASEIATRAALGASRWRVVRVFVTESLMFGVCGSGAGLLLGRGLSWWIASRMPEFPTAGRNLSLVPMLFDERAVIVAVTLGLTVAVAGGLWPALLAMRGPLMRQERSDGRVRRSASGRMARTMLVSELTVASVVVIGAVFVGLGIYRYLNQPLGYQMEDRFQVFVTGANGRSATGPDARAALAAVGQVGGVAAAALKHGGAFDGVLVPSSTVDLSEVSRVSVTAGYFEAWGIGIRAGRSFSASEYPDNGSVAMVSVPFAERLWPGGSALGQSIRAGGHLRQVIGVTEPLRWQLDVEPEAIVYVPAAGQQGATYVIAFIPGAKMESIGPLLSAAVARALPAAKVTVRPVTFGSMLERGAGEARFQGPVVIAFGILAATLAGIGVFGLVSYLVEQRTREFGIRMALGAKLQDIWRTVMRESLQPTVIGLTLGSAGALALESMVQSSIFGWKSSGPASIAIVAIGLLAVAVVAALVPAGRAARVDPAKTLRAE